jgi:hypothetical protein
MYRRLMDAEDRLDGVRRRRGVSETALGDTLEASESESALRFHQDVYIETVARYVAALGGHLEVRAVFADGAITLLREPAS